MSIKTCDKIESNALFPSIFFFDWPALFCRGDLFSAQSMKTLKRSLPAALSRAYCAHFAARHKNRRYSIKNLKSDFILDTVKTGNKIR